MFENDGSGSTYDDKTSFLLEHKIALWDVFRSADRKGALDADIRAEEPNDIAGLIQAYPGIKLILLAGRKAEHAFHRHFPDIGIDVDYVPSTSPAYAKKSFDGKTNDWKSAIIKKLDSSGK